MTDEREDQLVAALFNDVRHEVAGRLRPAGAAAAAATVRRRRRTRAVAGAALAVALVVGPAIGLAWARERPDPVPEIATTPTVGVSASPSQPSAPPSQPGSSAVADPGIPTDVLRDSTLSVPAWPAVVGDACPSGQLKFTDGKATRSGAAVPLTLAGEPVRVDVDGDRRNETVVRVDCPLQGMFTQVVAFSRGPDGVVTTLGRVVGTHVAGSDVQKVRGIDVGGPGTVRVEVGDVNPCCGVAADIVQHQWRTYGWDGRRFVQTAGPTTFPPSPKTTDLTLAAPYPMGMVSTDGATWLGGLTVTATNKGPNPATRLGVTLTFGVEVTLGGQDAGACGASPTTRSTTYTCRFAHLAAGVSRELRWDVTAYTSPRGTTTTVDVHHSDDTGDGYPDRRPSDNTVEVAVP